MENFGFYYKKENNSIFGEIKNKKLQYIVKDDLVGNIFRARVEKEIKALNAYVIDIGLDKKGLLRSKNAFNNTKPGDHILVEVIRESEGDKLYDLTEKISITDGYVVAVNRGKDKNKLILRSKAKDLPEEAINKRFSILNEKLKDIVKEKNLLPCPKLIYKSNRAFNMANTTVYPIYTNIKLDNKNQIYDVDFEPKTNLIISKGFEEIYSNKIKVNDQVFLIIEKTEAMWVIDVNSGGFKLDNKKENLSKEVNKLAIKEIVRLIKLKNIRKMLVIDFIRFDYRDRKEFENMFSDMLKAEKMSFKMFGFTKMGLFEIIIQ